MGNAQKNEKYEPLVHPDHSTHCTQFAHLSATSSKQKISHLVWYPKKFRSTSVAKHQVLDKNDSAKFKNEFKFWDYSNDFLIKVTSVYISQRCRLETVTCGL